MKGITADVAAWRKRAVLGLEQLKAAPEVDPERTAAIGYCFGGGTVLQMAYAGADVLGVVSFHGSLPSLMEGDEEQVKASILVLHGHADSFIPEEQVDVFLAGLERAEADWQLVRYGGARHGFTNPDAGDYGIPNLVYDPAADRRSWQAMEGLFQELFAQ
jgi:dienelactone hydrolase